MTTAAGPPPPPLTQRERVGIELLDARGLTPARIAHALNLNPTQVYAALTETDVWQRPATDTAHTEPNNPPIGTATRAQQQAAARAEALAYYGGGMTGRARRAVA